MRFKKMNSKCILCLLNRYLNDYPKDFTADKKLEYMQDVLKIIGNAEVFMSAPEIVEKINHLKQSMGFFTDFSEIKSYYNKYMLSLEEDIESRIKSAQNPLKTAVQYAMAGNFIDFGAMKSVDEQRLKSFLDNPSQISIEDAEFEAFEKEITTARNIAFLTDNCGEIVLDKLLIKQILSINKGVNIDVIVRGGPVLNDCTLEDAKEVGLDNLVNVIGNGTAVGGTALNKISKNAREIIDNADLVISKGQGNFETLNQCGKNIYYLFLCKCDLFAENFKVEKFSGMFINEKNILK